MLVLAHNFELLIIMKKTFSVELTSYEILQVLPHGWDNDDYRAILKLLDCSEISAIKEADLKDMCFMYIADQSPEDSANLLLNYIFEDRLNSGQKDQLSHEMQSENMWEEYAELSMHQELFNVGQLLYMAYNGKFPKPEAVQFSITLKTPDVNSFQVFEASTEANLIRTLVQGMPENTLLKRLFSDKLKEGEFPEAQNIIWQFVKSDENDGSLKFDVISSQYFFQDLKFVNNFEATLVLPQE